MWFLFIVTLFGTTYLEKYTTQSECESERIRITQALQEAYPEDTNFRLACILRSSEASL